MGTGLWVLLFVLALLFEVVCTFIRRPMVRRVCALAGVAVFVLALVMVSRGTR